MFQQMKTAGWMALVCSGLLLASCSNNDNGTNNSDTNARLQVRLTDAPTANLAEVWVNIQEIRINRGDSAWQTLTGAYPGLYNLLDLTNGQDTLLADAQIPAGRLSQIRLVLGTNNYVVTSSGQQFPLETPSAQQSGLKVQVNDSLSSGVLYRLILDFDAARSVVQAGNSGRYILKPVIRVISFAPSGGNVKGWVLPDSVRTAIYAINGSDTVASTYSDTAQSGAYLFNNIAAGNYTLSYVPESSSYRDTSRSVSVTLGQTTTVDSVWLPR